MMSRAGLAPLVAELSCSACEAHSHIGVAECEDRAFLVDALSYNTGTIFMVGFLACEMSASPEPECPIMQMSSSKSMEYISES